MEYSYTIITTNLHKLMYILYLMLLKKNLIIKTWDELVNDHIVSPKKLLKLLILLIVIRIAFFYIVSI